MFQPRTMEIILKKGNSMKILFLFALIFVSVGCASGSKGSDNSNSDLMTGVVFDDSNSHDDRHEHILKFKDNTTGEVYSLAHNQGLLDMHHNSERNVMVELKGEIKSKFIIWGQELVVKEYKVLQEVGEKIPHKKYNESSKDLRSFQNRVRSGRDLL